MLTWEEPGKWADGAWTVSLGLYESHTPRYVRSRRLDASKVQAHRKVLSFGVGAPKLKMPQSRRRNPPMFWGSTLSRRDSSKQEHPDLQHPNGSQRIHGGASVAWPTFGAFICHMD